MVKLPGRRRGSNDRRAGSLVAAPIPDVVRTGDTGAQTLQCGTVGADAVKMRLSILVYGVLYVVLEMVGHALETVGWGRVTPLHVASALVDALLLIVMAIAVLVLWDVARRRWGPRFRAWQQRQLAAAAEFHEPIGVQSWRPESEPPPGPLAVAAAPSTGTYGTPSRSRRFREDPGQLL